MLIDYTVKPIFSFIFIFCIQSSRTGKGDRRYRSNIRNNEKLIPITENSVKHSLNLSLI